jgi:hypothetical protein
MEEGPVSLCATAGRFEQGAATTVPDGKPGVNRERRIFAE